MGSLSQLMHIIYPPRCHLCGCFLALDKGAPPTPYLCSNCFRDLAVISHPMCTVCGIPFPSSTGRDHLCENCLRKTPWYDLVRSPYLYEGTLMRAIQRFKYGRETDLASSFGTLLCAFARQWIPDPENWLAVPVPLHRGRLRERGFNQSLLLAKALSLELGSGLDYLCLTRTRYTQPQTGLGKDERRKNIKGAFSVTRNEVFKGNKVLLIDDVFTTGHTLSECAKTLKKAGCLLVWCLALARTRVD